MKNLLELLGNQAINISLIWSDLSIWIALLLLVLVLILYFYAKDLRDIISETKDELNHKIELYNLSYKASVSKITYLNLLEVNKMIESKNNELIVESLEQEKRINNLIQSKWKLAEEINEKDERINKLTSQVKKTKYVPLNQQKEAESDWWEAKNNNYSYFVVGEKYEKALGHSREHMLLLKSSKGSFLVNKADFKPVQP